LAVTLTVAGVLPLVGVEVNHAAVVVTVKVCADPVLVTDTFWTGAAAPPARPVKVRLVGVTEILPPPSSADTVVRARGRQRINNGIAKRINPVQSRLRGYFFFMSFLLEALR
jgi:hypothetical protein